jgi:DNA-binding SARP family transcriptional activator
MSSVQLSFLGPAQFKRDSGPVDLNVAKAVALLGYLAITSSSHSRDYLIDLFWPDSLPKAGRKNLRNTLWVIRKALGDELIFVGGSPRRRYRTHRSSSVNAD